MKDDPFWIDRGALLAVHGQMLARFGGLAGVRDESLLDSALARPRHQFAYGDSDLCVLAAAYAFGIANNHPFNDGNKRTAFMAAAMFLEANGFDFVADPAVAAQATLGLADKSVSESNFAQWLRDSTRPALPPAAG